MTGGRAAGFAVKRRAQDVAGHLYPYLRDSPPLAGCRVVVVTALGQQRRLLRRSLNSYWYGGGFRTLCEQIPDTARDVPSPIVLFRSPD